jgi:formamidopyrimidine-DNA glycosylase
MPELPEVETVRLQLSSLVIGKKIKIIQVLNRKTFTGDPDLLINNKIIKLRRFAKILFIDLDNELSIAVHLKMSGQLIYQETINRKQKTDIILPNKHTRVIVEFKDGSKLFFNDMRKFGWMRIVSSVNSQQITDNEIINLHELISGLGPDPLTELTQDKLLQILHTSKKAVKLVLMDQGKIAGVGNIYANEALFMSGIHPKEKADKISKRMAGLLLNNLQKILKNAIKWGGASSNLYLNAYGEKGSVQKYLAVYDRKDLECVNKCGSKIMKIKLGGRGTYFCPKCQKMT